MTQNRPPDDDDVRAGLETKPFLAHLEDLRWTIIRCIGALVVGVIICAFTAPYILDALYVPYRQTGRDPKDLFNFGVVDPFSIHMEISLFGGIILSLPFLLYFVGQFLLPALTPREKRFLAPIFAAGAALFIAGVTLCYTFALKATLEFFFAYSKYLGFEATWTAKALIDFEVQMLLGFGLAFELPLVILVLNLFGIVSAAQLASKRRHAALTIFIATCCIIPSSDPFSLSLLSVPMYLLYESCIWIARAVERRRAVD
ncbi:MAG TPA: twin-arginine translocase subunit TatC [Candidatus Methylacidiphilales bacterium]|jgi:sec-independent protein translocase protein TatC|nr:twin-arginine translocase subunit TatC [Candidatus Methylacidiphilales bacterium]